MKSPQTASATAYFLAIYFWPQLNSSECDIMETLLRIAFAEEPGNLSAEQPARCRQAKSAGRYRSESPALGVALGSGPALHAFAASYFGR